MADDVMAYRLCERCKRAHDVLAAEARALRLDELQELVGRPQRADSLGDCHGPDRRGGDHWARERDSLGGCGGGRLGIATTGNIGASRALSQCTCSACARIVHPPAAGTCAHVYGVHIRVGGQYVAAWRGGSLRADLGGGRDTER
jgi:hypothetical protein